MAKRKAVCVHAQPCPPLRDSHDCSLTGSSVHGIFQARILEWVAISFSRGIFLTQGLNYVCPSVSPALQAGSLPLAPPGKPYRTPITVTKAQLAQLLASSCLPGLW